MPPSVAADPPASCALDARGVAATNRVVRLNVGDLGQSQQPLDLALELAAVDESSVCEVVVGLEAAQRDLANPQHLWNLVDRLERALGTLANKDRVTRLVRGARGLVHVVDEQQHLA